MARMHFFIIEAIFHWEWIMAPKKKLITDKQFQCKYIYKELWFASFVIERLVFLG